EKGIATLLQLLLAFIIVSVGASRIYLGVHFPSDVLGGYLLSLSWLFLTYPTYREKKEQIELQTID
ncbi:phosphatase PAP2 family protein, partial [Enterococcus durans]